jgi:TolB-like protein/DNA-binding winged helix-turn-helix (wHTH) protein/Flp pilus assembly protein TadD
MAESTRSATTVRFGVFEADLQAGQLRKKGRQVRLQEQPFQVLALLLERPGEVVTREALRERLWPADTFVEFDHSLNTAVGKIREALGDSADNPRFVETLPRRGYRFIAPVETQEQAVAEPRSWQRPVWVAALAAVALVVLILGLNLGGMRDRLLGKPAPGEIASLAVLPLENLSGDPKQEYFADGMTEALTTELGKISALRVISRQSVMRYKGTDKPLPEIARELNVDAVVEGAALQEGDRVRISAQLIQTAPERHLWAQSYERDLRQVISLQSDVARAIADEIKITLTPDEEARLASTRPVNPEAYEAYLKGGYFQKPTEESLQKSIEYFQQAISIDPNYAPVYAKLAFSHIMLAAFNFAPDSEHYPKARKAALKALDIDDTVAEAHAALGHVKFRFDWDWTGAESELRRAIELDPNSVVAHNGYAYYLDFMGRTEEALAEMKRARALDPFPQAIAAFQRFLELEPVGWFLYHAHQYDQAIAAFQRFLELEPEFPHAHLGIGLAYVQKEMYEEAIAELQEAVALGGVDGPSTYTAMLAYAYAVSGRKTEARKILNELKQQMKQRHVSPFNIAEIHTGLGEKDRAFEWLEKAYEERDEDLIWFRDPILDPLRDDPRFHSLLRRMNFPE